MKISIDKKKQKRIEGAILSLFLCVLILVSIKHVFYYSQESAESLVLGRYRLIPLGIYIILSLCISMIILFPVKVWPGFTRNIMNGILVVFMPIISFITFEYINGGLKNIVAGGLWRVILNIVLYTAVYWILAVIISRIYVAFAFAAVLFYLIALINYFVVQFRGEPVTILDTYNLSTAATVSSGYVYQYSTEMILPGMFILVCVGLLLQNTGYKLTRISRISGFITSTSLLLFLYSEIGNTEALHRYRLNGVNFWSFQIGYEQDGFLLSSLELTQFLIPAVPEGYSMDLAKNILSDISDAIFSVVDDTNDVTLPENVIVIMNESFSDLSSLGTIATSEELTPYLNSLSERTIRGNTLVSAFGGSTANSEFEFLTGHSAAYIPPGTIPYQLYMKEGMSSLVSSFKNEGYNTIALHPFVKSNYNRINVYRNLGFDEYYGENDFDFSHLRYFVSDQSDFETVIKLFREKKKGTRQFMFNVTMQNHGGYESEDYKPNVSLTDYPDKYPQAEQYLSLIRETDLAFSSLVDYFTSVDEKTVILMFGDHLPSLEEEFYQELLGETNDESFRDNLLKRYTTQYILWSNYDLGIDEIGDTSLNFLGSKLLKGIGIPLTSYHQFLLSLSDIIPALNQYCFLDKDNRAFWNDEQTDYSEWMDKYRLLQYHMMFGN